MKTKNSIESILLIDFQSMFLFSDEKQQLILILFTFLAY